MERHGRVRLMQLVAVTAVWGGIVAYQVSGGEGEKHLKLINEGSRLANAKASARISGRNATLANALEEPRNVFKPIWSEEPRTPPPRHDSTEERGTARPSIAP